MFLNRNYKYITLLFISFTAQYSFAGNKHVAISALDKNWEKTIQQKINQQVSASSNLDTLFIEFSPGTYLQKETLLFQNKKLQSNTRYWNTI